MKKMNYNNLIKANFKTMNFVENPQTLNTQFLVNLILKVSKKKIINLKLLNLII